MSAPQPAQPPAASCVVDFLSLLQKLKTTKRTGWIRKGIPQPESISDHMYRMGMMGIVSGGQPGTNQDRCVKMAIVHDVAEAIVGDITPFDGVSKSEKQRLETEAIQQIKQMLGETSAAGAEIEELWNEYEEGCSANARLVKDFDKVEMILQAFEYEQAYQINCQEFFDSTQGKLTTPTAQAWADEIIARRKHTQSQSKQDTPAPELDVQAVINFHGADYAVHLTTVNGETLKVLIEQQEDASRWQGEFSAKHIEDVTSKTGSFKKYGVFIRMLITAIQQTSESVVVDLLTFADLEELKSRRAAPSAAGAASKPAGPPAQQSQTGLQPSNKRYLILTYAAEFDRVHYPLPLAYEERPDPDRLKGLIRQLRFQLTEAGQKPAARKGNDPWAEVHRLREENARLQRQVKQASGSIEEPGTPEELARLVEEVQESARELHLVRQERDLLQQRSESVRG
ncbi:hypothetical protein WJX84_003167 [Apatococcus fuscideae]|uniref:5'-deoxynucleotidase n=1 Tax=Apatococcus fuscideae TaxID=2026836 RepID=A0AAW1TEH0_9CHLO